LIDLIVHIVLVEPYLMVIVVFIVGRAITFSADTAFELEMCFKHSWKQYAVNHGHHGITQAYYCENCGSDIEINDFLYDYT